MCPKSSQHTRAYLSLKTKQLVITSLSRIYLYTLYYCMMSCTKLHFADGNDSVLPQRWAIIIDAVTTLEWRWASSRIALNIYCHLAWCSHIRQYRVIVCILLLTLMSNLGGGGGGLHARWVCPPGVQSQIGLNRLITGRVSVEITKSASVRMGQIHSIIMHSIIKITSLIFCCHLSSHLSDAICMVSLPANTRQWLNIVLMLG